MTGPSVDDVDSVATRLVGGDRAALARAITWTESRKQSDRARVDDLLQRLPRNDSAARIGVTGLPGAGKSTLIEHLGQRLVRGGHRVAVLAADPVSVKSGGALLGDKTRMETLAASDAAFVRPSPAGPSAGGLGSSVHDAMLLCEAAGYDVVFLETVGVGQADVHVAALVDLVVLLLLPGAGDELQGMKRGLIEFADVVGITRADGESEALARSTRDHYAAALQLLRGAVAEVHCVSAPNGVGLETLEGKVVSVQTVAPEEKRRRRADHRVAWFTELVSRGVADRFLGIPQVQQRVQELVRDIAAGSVSPVAAATELLERVSVD